jgi:uncharacterized protein YkwD
MRRLVAPGLFAAIFGLACTTTPGGPGAAPAADDPRLPEWLGAPPGVERTPELEEAAALLCARDTDGVLDEDARHAARLADGQLFGLLKRAAEPEAAARALSAAAGPLLEEKRATHAGVVVGATPAGEACAAMVAARRLVTLAGAGLPSALPPGAALEIDVRLPRGKRGVLYVMKPDGFVTRQSLPDAGGPARLTVPPSAGDGRYVVEIVLDVAEGASDPEIALLWPYLVGAPRVAPAPAVLFPDEGHSDRALGHRAEALLQRLRNEQLIEPFKVSPPLIEIAAARAASVATRGALGHRLPPIAGDGKGEGSDALQDLRARFGAEPRASFLRLAEVQAQASTLAEAWEALLDSPAHRYELVDTAFTHAGAAVARGRDAAGRETVTLVALLARRPPNRDADAVRAHILEAANETRKKRGLDALRESSHLNRIATRLAGAMKEHRRVDDALLGGPVASVALEADASLSRVKPLVARTDDPLLLLQNGVPPMLLEIDAAQAGVGIALEGDEGVFYVVLLAGE